MEKRPEEKPIAQLLENLPELGDFDPAGQPPPRAGTPCPKCGLGILEYDGLLVLRCPRCDFTEGGCFT